MQIKKEESKKLYDIVLKELNIDPNLQLTYLKIEFNVNQTHVEVQYLHQDKEE